LNTASQGPDDEQGWIIKFKEPEIPDHHDDQGDGVGSEATNAQTMFAKFVTILDELVTERMVGKDIGPDYSKLFYDLSGHCRYRVSLHDLLIL